MKMKIYSKLLLSLLSVGILFSMGQAASAANERTVAGEGNIARGEVNEDYGQLTWVIDQNGKLTVNGTGDYYQGEYSDMPPWHPYAREILTAELNITGMTNAGSLFYACENLQSVDLSGFDTSNLHTMADMFANCEQLKKIDLSNFQTQKVTNMAGMFRSCGSLETIDLGNFDTGNVEYMVAMFQDCKMLKSIDFSNFDFCNVISTGSMFYGCESLNEVDLSNFQSENLLYTSEMFRDCTSLKKVELEGFTTGNVIDMNYMFMGCTALETLDVSTLDTKNVETLYGMFKDCSSLEYIDGNIFTSDTPTEFNEMFSGCSSLKQMDLSKLSGNMIVEMEKMFYNCTSLKSLDMSVLDTDLLKNMDEMFYGCKSLEWVDMRDCNLVNLSSAKWVFRGCKKLNRIETPIYCSADIELPIDADVTQWFKFDSAVGSLPRNLSYSITLTRFSIPEAPSISLIYKDVYEGEWYVPYVWEMHYKKLMKGDGTYFRPLDNITKAEVAVLLHRLEGEPHRGNWDACTILKDVVWDIWYTDAICWAYNNGIITGDLNSMKFYPDSSITREQLALMLYRYMQYKQEDVSQMDDLKGLQHHEQVSNWAKPAVKWAVGTGVIQGMEIYKDGKVTAYDLAPQKTASRAQMAAILTRLLEH